jgi:hypothetical protein
VARLIQRCNLIVVSVFAGLPVTIGWRHCSVERHDLDVYEFVRRREKRSRKPKPLTDTYRYRYLQSLGKYSPDEVFDVLAEIAVIQKSRKWSAGAENRDKFDVFHRTYRFRDEISKLAVGGKLRIVLENVGKKSVHAAEVSSKAAKAIATAVVRSPARTKRKVAHSPKSRRVKEAGEDLFSGITNRSPKSSQDGELGQSMPLLALLDDDDDASIDIVPEEGLKRQPLTGIERLWRSHSIIYG